MPPPSSRTTTAAVDRGATGRATGENCLCTAAGDNGPARHTGGKNSLIPACLDPRAPVGAKNSRCTAIGNDCVDGTAIGAHVDRTPGVHNRTDPGSASGEKLLGVGVDDRAGGRAASRNLLVP